MMYTKPQLILIFIIACGLAGQWPAQPQAQTALDQAAASAPVGHGPMPAAQPPAPIPTPSLLALPEELTQTVARLTAEIERAEKAVERAKDREDDLSVQRG